MIDYHTTDFSEVLEDVDLVFDTMGGDIQKASFEVLNPKGRLISVVDQPDEELAKNIAVAKVFGFNQTANNYKRLLI